MNGIADRYDVIVIGEILADLAVDGETDHPIGMFGLERFDDGME